jgi:CO/xanthine dehydrogenase FAD-binding subunit
MLLEFEFLMPQALSEALSMLVTNGSSIMPVSGGTDLIGDIRSGRQCPSTLMDISHLSELQGIQLDDGHLVIGANSTIAELLTNPLIAQYAPVLKEAAAVFANPLVRNRATVGGNLASASPAADTAPPLLVMDAEVELISQGGKRLVPLSLFLVDVRKTLRQPDELLVSIRFPICQNRCFSAFTKLGLRKADAIAVVNVAVMVEADGNGRCRQVRVALGAVTPRPLRAMKAEDHLRGKLLTAQIISEAADLAAKASNPIDDIRGSAAYRQRMVEVLVRRLLGRAANEFEK